MRIRLNLPQKGLILVCVPLVFELVFVGVLTILLQQAEVEIKREARAMMVLSTANQFVTIFHEAASKLVEYGLSRSETSLRQYEEIVSQYPIRCASLREIVKDSPSEVKMVDEMEKTCDEGVELLNINKEQLVTGGRLEALRRFRLDRTQVKDLIDRIVFQTK